MLERRARIGRRPTSSSWVDNVSVPAPPRTARSCGGESQGPRGHHMVRKGALAPSLGSPDVGLAGFGSGLLQGLHVHHQVALPPPVLGAGVGPRLHTDTPTPCPTPLCWALPAPSALRPLRRQFPPARPLRGPPPHSALRTRGLSSFSVAVTSREQAVLGTARSPVSTGHSGLRASCSVGETGRGQASSLLHCSSSCVW